MRLSIKAIVLTKYGSSGVLQLQEVAKPIPKDNELLVKIHVTSINLKSHNKNCLGEHVKYVDTSEL